MRYEIYWYAQPIKEYLQPVIQNKRAMNKATEEFLKLDEDPSYLAGCSIEFLKGINSVPDELDEGTMNQNEDSDFSGDEDDSGVDLGTADFEPHSPQPRPDSRPAPGGFMNWQSFDSYKLSKKPDCVDDKRKSIISFWQAIKLGIPTPIGSVSVEGLFGLLARVLQPQDYRAYFKSTRREILLPDFMKGRHLSTREIDIFELNLFDPTNFIGGSSTMTCLTYNDNEVGTISQFEFDLMKTKDGEWPREIRPVAAMTGVPKKILKMMVKSMPKSKVLQLQVKTKGKNQLNWVTKMPDGVSLALEWSPNVRRRDLSTKFRQALAIEPEELTFSNGEIANHVQATIPAMIAWLHVKSSYLTNIDIEGIKFVNGRKIASWYGGPEKICHEGNNPRIVVLHPKGGDWVTTLVYWDS